MSLRVLHIGKFYPPDRGGMELYLHDLVNTQRAQGIDAAAVVHGDPLPGDPPWLTRVPVQLRMLYAPIALGFRPALARLIDRFRPDVLHLHLPNTSAFWVLTMPQARALPWVVHWHSDVVLSQLRWSLAAAYSVYRPFEQALLDGAECVIATSEPYLQASAALRRWRHKCVVVPLGIATALLPDPAACAQAAAGRRAADGTAWHAHTSLRLLSIGRLTYYKGFETLIEAVQALPDDVELLIAGDGELDAALQTLIRDRTPHDQRPRVRLLGSVSEAEKHALLAGCDIFCLASRERTEAFGMVILEAMHHARACLVTDLPGSGMPWLVAQAGCGLQVPIEDVVGWTSAIARLRFDPALRQRLGAAGQAALGRLFDIHASAAAIERRYRGLAPAAPTGARAAETARNRSRLLIALVTHNDAAAIDALIAGAARVPDADLLMIDQRSTDGCTQAAERAGAVVLRPLLALTRWGATQTALRWALAHGYAGVVTVDSRRADWLPQVGLLTARRDVADLVIGADVAGASARRRLAWRWFRRLAGFDWRDPTSGFRYYGARAIALLAARDATLLDDADVGALLLARRAGLRIEEVMLPAGLQTSPAARAGEAAGMAGRSTATGRTDAHAPMSTATAKATSGSGSGLDLADPSSVLSTHGLHGLGRRIGAWWSTGRYLATTTLLCVAHHRRPARSQRPLAPRG